MKHVKNSISMLFENGLMIVVDKPAGVMSADMTGSKLLPVHPIDPDTTGVVLFAKNAESQAFLSRQFKEGSAHTVYYALLNGAVIENEGVIDNPIHSDGNQAYTDPCGKPSETRFRVIERFKSFTLVEAEPRTGSRHQLRVHFRSFGNPLAIAPEYGGRRSLFLSEFKRKYKTTGDERPLMSRLSLHAGRITFTDPATQQPMKIEAPLPDDFEVTLKQLRKHNKL